MGKEEREEGSSDSKAEGLKLKGAEGENRHEDPSPMVLSGLGDAIGSNPKKKAEKEIMGGAPRT